MADEPVRNVRRIGDAQQALTKLTAPPQVQQLDLQPAPPAAAGTATAAAAPGTGANAAPAPAPGAAPRALPAPTITVNSAGEAMTNAQMANRAALGNTPDVAAAARARLAGTATAAPAAAAAPAAGPAPATAPAAAASPQPLPAYRNPAVGPGQPNFVQTPEPTNPNFRPTPTPAAAPAAAGETATSRSLLSRIGGAAAPLGNVAGKLARGAGYVNVGLNAIDTVNQTAAGNYGAAAESGGIGLLNAAALAAPSPLTIGGAIVGSSANALAQTAPAQRAFELTANNLPGNGRAQADTAIGGLRDLVGSRERAGLPLGTIPDRLEAAQNMRAQQFGGGVIVVDPSNPYTQGTAPPAGGAPNASANFSNVRSGSATGPAPAVEVPAVPRGGGAADPATWSQNARNALSSTAPGTAVINGQTYTPDQINALANRNVVSSEGFRNPGLGVAFSEATGGQTPELGQGAAGRQAGFSAADRQRQLAAIESGPDSRAEAADRARTSSRNRMVEDARSALRSGRRRTAGRLIDLLTATNGAETADARVAAANRPQRAPAGRTDAQEALTAAQIENEQAQTATSRQRLATENRMGQLQDAVLNARTPQEQQEAGRALALLSGRDLPQHRQQVVRVPAPGTDPALGITAPAIFDPQTGSLSWPKGLSAVYTDAQGNQQRRDQ
jgi:hypothetical protein